MVLKSLGKQPLGRLRKWIGWIRRMLRYEQNLNNLGSCFMIHPDIICSKSLGYNTRVGALCSPTSVS
jgi:hypothetical protein